jgi:RNase P subunit RPR2
MKTKLRVKCSACGFWNRFETERLVAQQDTSEPEAIIVYPVHSPTKLETCEKCGKIISESKEPIRITRKEGSQSS